MSVVNRLPCPYIVTIAVTIDGLKRHAGAQPLRDGSADRAFRLNKAIVARLARDIAIQLRARICRDDIDRTRHGVPAIKRSLWTAKHLDAIDIVKRRERSLRATLIHIVFIYCHASLTAGGDAVVAHTPNENLRVPAEASEFDVRDALTQFLNGFDAGALKVLAANSSDRERSGLRVL